jgi:DNA repair exonuclease SbcCD ATPase subunit
VDEIKEIANELGVSANVDNLEKLKQIREVINDRETGLLDQITDLQQKINDYEAAKAEAQRRAVEKVKKGRTVDSKAITELKQAKDHISELENEILELEQNRDDFSDLLKAEGIEHASTKRKLENATKAAETLDTRLKTARAEKTE